MPCKFKVGDRVKHIFNNQYLTVVANTEVDKYSSSYDDERERYTTLCQYPNGQETEYFNWALELLTPYKYVPTNGFAKFQKRISNHVG